MSVDLIPYESIARVEAGEIMDSSVGNILNGLQPNHQVSVAELLVEAYFRGLEHGFAMNEPSDTNPITHFEAYLEGINDSKNSGGSQ